MEQTSPGNAPLVSAAAMNSSLSFHKIADRYFWRVYDGDVLLAQSAVHYATKEEAEGAWRRLRAAVARL